MRRCCPGRCRPTCDPLPTFSNGEAVLDVAGDNTPGSTATVQCANGYETDGVVTLTCGLNKAWMPKVLEPCSSIACNPLPTFSNGEALLDVAGDNTPGATATVQCVDGYETDGVVTLTCGVNKAWTPGVLEPCNVITCPPLPTFPNGEALFDVAGDNTPGATATVQCVDGYETDGVVTLTCGLDNGWTPEVPEPCSLITCNPLPTFSNGESVLDVAGDNTPGSTATVQCANGYETDGVVTLTCGVNKTWTPDVLEPCNPCDTMACDGCCPPGEWLDSTGTCVGVCTGGDSGFNGPDYILHDKLEVLCPIDFFEIFVGLCECIDTCTLTTDCRSVTYYKSEGRCYVSGCDPNQNLFNPSNPNPPVLNVGVEDAALFIRNCASP